MIKKLYLDLDGVFADFHGGFKRVSGQEIHEVPKNKMWAIVHSNKRFFAELEFMPGALELWEACRVHKPIFLTGAPSSHAFREQKKEWVAAKFGHEHETIVLPRRDKKNYSAEGHVLIDDTEENILEWRKAGGIGLLYTGDHLTTIGELMHVHEHGFHPWWVAVQETE